MENHVIDPHTLWIRSRIRESNGLLNRISGLLSFSLRDSGVITFKVCKDFPRESANTFALKVCKGGNNYTDSF